MNAPDKNTSQYSHITDEGSVHELNEDSIYCSGTLWLVADGMGGHACGEVASKLAKETVVGQYNTTGQLSDAIQTAHKKILEVSQNNISQSGMGTTIVTLANTENNYEIAWVGDSRAYLWESKHKKLSPLTEDHSLLTKLINANLISAEEATNHPKRHVLTQSLGSKDVVDIQVDTLHGEWRSHQQILLCSDGLTDELTEQEIAVILKKPMSNDEKVRELLDTANHAGGKDNISIILVDTPILETSSIWNKLKSIFS